ncbi:SMI1/KNR4 family protein [Escherichia coli]|uniref:SMI1/KNR4 family protein n=1 Tax=Escherichia sp. MOD1-EC7003 TaxID=2093900 RepID=UPI000CF7B1AA|nr:SMI1/KNR4 family protein [Escherichia sp. MOD1-EC7003]EGO8360475.1 SMI1/KNR4 family protein [Escherichia coli]EGO8377963.1 SMI1/KNR4 family protein [Escherichia coli]MCH0693721.1 SMI1/KNR4 family protein [Escherichia coli]
MSIYQDYLNGLAEHFQPDISALFATFTGADETDIAELIKHYPDSPSDLLGLLRSIKGTHYELHQSNTICLPVLGSDVAADQYPYYLRSVAQILEDKNGWFGKETIEEIYNEDIDCIELDERIDITVPFSQRLCFAHCINNGGTSQLYIDYAPSNTGKYGQIVRYLHDPDSYQVIADNFAQYLTNIMQDEYPFINPNRIASDYLSFDE